MDSSSQLAENFSVGFSADFLQKFTRVMASKIVTLYTETGDNKLNIRTPMQKFDTFFNQILPNETEFSYKGATPNVQNNSQAVINNLLMGNTIPDYLLEEVAKIASGKKVTTNLNSGLQAIIHNTNSTNSISPNIETQKSTY